MFALFQSVVDRIKALFAADAALDFESQFLARQADRKAELLRKAGQLEKEGLTQIAQELRAQAQGLSIQRPVEAVSPAFAELAGRPSSLPVSPAHSLTNGDSHPARNDDRPTVAGSLPKTTGRRRRR